MEIKITSVEKPVAVSIIHIIGEVDSATAGELQKKVSETLAVGAKNLVFDLEKVPYMSSAGLRVFLKTFQTLRELFPTDKQKDASSHIADGTYRAAHLKLLNPTSKVLEVLKISGLDMLVSIEHDLKKALKFD
jgi:ABC-type transporter Mla MlaB component